MIFNISKVKKINRFQTAQKIVSEESEGTLNVPLH
jgi:hypothetical protein